MNIHRVAAIALSNRAYDSFADCLAEAGRWVSLAARLGAGLAVLPEYLNCYSGDGEGTPRRVEDLDAAGWQEACAPLLEVAAAAQISVAVPLVLATETGRRNRFYVVEADGTVCGWYDKLFPTESELDVGIVPGKVRLIPWRGLQLGGAICFDMNFPETWAWQTAAGADLFLAPSRFPGGDQVNYYAARHATPVALSYPAWSRLVDDLGREVAGGGYRQETLRFGFGTPVYTADLNFDRTVFHFDHNQTRIEDILRRYGDRVGLEFDQPNVRFALESRDPEVTIDDLIAEFDLEPLPAYLARVEARIRASRPAAT